MERPVINFHKTSNSPVEINEMICPYCNESFYELEDYELEKCPLCNTDFDAVPYKNEWDSDTFTLIVDPKTGIPSVIRNDEFEPAMSDGPTDD